MKRTIRLLLTLTAAALPPASAQAAALVIVKSSTVVADSVNAVNPKALPGATIDYSLLVSNPNAVLSGVTFRFVVITDPLPANTIFNAADYGAAGSGPIEFVDGGLLGTGLLGSGLSYTFKGLADDTDGVEFFDGTSWNYHPVAGYDPNVKAVRVTLTGTQAVASGFRLRFRVKLK